ncbi:MAG: hypothetical protein IJY67_02255 [Paludibacteraceae bacterium]|nr:hypothetical protein [Paludibacteraceae bacterium]
MGSLAALAAEPSRTATRACSLMVRGCSSLVMFVASVLQACSWPAPHWSCGRGGFPGGDL